MPPLPARGVAAEVGGGSEIHPIAGAMGAEISGADLSRDLPAETVGEIRRALGDKPR